MFRFLTFDGAQKQDPAVAHWFALPPAQLRLLAQKWFSEMRACGTDVVELLHDGHPTACVDNGAFAYVSVFTSHVNVGFFHGATLADPARILEGTGRFMRHVKIRQGTFVHETALRDLVHAAYADIKLKLVARNNAVQRTRGSAA